MSDLTLERKNQPNETAVFGSEDGPTLLLTPPIDEDYWEYRVRLSETQAIVGFPKFSTVGIGFARKRTGTPTSPTPARRTTSSTTSSTTRATTPSATLTCARPSASSRSQRRRSVVSDEPLIDAARAEVNDRQRSTGSVTSWPAASRRSDASGCLRWMLPASRLPPGHDAIHR